MRSEGEGGGHSPRRTSRAVQRLSISRFEAGDITPAEFGHEAHMFVGWLYAMEYDEYAHDRFDLAFRRLVKKLGAESKYNVVITWLFMKLISDRARRDESWEGFLARNRDLLDELPQGVKPDEGTGE